MELHYQDDENIPYKNQGEAFRLQFGGNACIQSTLERLVRAYPRLQERVFLFHVIVSKIFLIRNQQVMIDRDLAELYNVQTKVLNQSIKRNIERFPIEFRFQLTEKEMIELVTNCDRFESLKHTSFY